MPELLLPEKVCAPQRNEILKGLNWIDPELQNFEFRSEDDSNQESLKYDYTGDQHLSDIQSKIEKVIESVFLTFDKEEEPHVETNFKNPIKSNTLTELQESGMVIESSPGVYIWRGLALQLFKAIDKLVLNYGNQLGFEEWMTPNIASVSSLNSSGYLKNFPQHVHLLGHLPEQSEVISKARIEWDDPEMDSVSYDSAIFNPKMDSALSPTICCHIFHSLKGQVLPADQTMRVTAMNSCFRYEGRSTAGLTRLKEFHMRELVAIGLEEHVLKQKDGYIQFFELLLNQLRLDGRIQDASDPFFFDELAGKRLFQKSFRLKQELLLRVDGPEEFTAAGSANFHQNHFGHSLNISVGNQEAYSACAGFGLDRICFAFFSQHGLEPLKWPVGLRQLLKF